MAAGARFQLSSVRYMLEPVGALLVAAASHDRTRPSEAGARQSKFGACNALACGVLNHTLDRDASGQVPVIFIGSGSLDLKTLDVTMPLKT